MSEVIDFLLGASVVLENLLNEKFRGDALNAAQESALRVYGKKLIDIAYVPVTGVVLYSATEARGDLNALVDGISAPDFVVHGSASEFKSALSDHETRLARYLIVKIFISLGISPADVSIQTEESPQMTVATASPPTCQQACWIKYPTDVDARNMCLALCP